MVRTILCYGDSLTWGYDAAGPSRHAYEDRWPSVLQEALGAGARVIVEALNGRTTSFDDTLVWQDRNGARVLPTVLASHEPLDLVILALGTNDFKRHTGGGNASQSARGMKRLIEIVRGFPSTFGYAAPEILLVSPPRLATSDNADFRDGLAFAAGEVARLPQLYAELASQHGCDHFAASNFCEATPLDGVDLDAANTRAWGRAIARHLQQD
ncbi:SGNH/GDSL hydrolase family protein [Aureimonas sp. ME7]|uniref:SGNH/GDSL hydrolase family protein n=1 Tax=Aureimonas sp. ME7 TaxID=2744252 RepID=UPI0015F6E489|nr:SGNH/GDSL hydrolase family protein [Aureimonas sp. ME7]